LRSNLNKAIVAQKKNRRSLLRLFVASVVDNDRKRTFDKLPEFSVRQIRVIDIRGDRRDEIGSKYGSLLLFIFHSHSSLYKAGIT